MSITLATLYFSINKMVDISSVEELRTFVDKYLELQFECGYQKPMHNLIADV